MVVTYFVDVDQTVSTGHVCASLAESISYYQDRGVIVPNTIETWPDLFQLPDVARQHEVLPGAQAGVRKLTEGCKMFYLTARKPDVYDITSAWLAEHGFPSPNDVIFVEGVPQKLLALAEYDGPLFLVDDRWRQLLDILEKYSQRRSLAGLYGRLTLVAFGACKSDIPASPIVPVVPLLNWSWMEASDPSGQKETRSSVSPARSEDCATPAVVASTRKDGLV